MSVCLGPCIIAASTCTVCAFVVQNLTNGAGNMFIVKMLPPFGQAKLNDYTDQLGNTSQISHCCIGKLMAMMALTAPPASTFQQAQVLVLEA